MSLQERSNRELCMSTLHPCDCFVLRNDIDYIKNYADSQRLKNRYYKVRSNRELCKSA